MKAFWKFGEGRPWLSIGSASELLKNETLLWFRWPNALD